MSTSNSKKASTVVPIAEGTQSLRRQRRAAEILAAAQQVFLDKGYEKSAISEIAARVGVVEGLVYSYFPTKRDLLHAVLRRGYEPLIDDVRGGYARLSGLRSRMRFLVWRHLRFYVEEPGLARLVLHEVRTGPDYFSSGLHQLHVQYTQFLLRAVQDAIADGELPADTDAEMVRAMIYGGLEHMMWPVLYGHGRVDAELAADRYTDVVLNGLRGAHGATAAASANLAAGVPDPIEERLARLERMLAARVVETTDAVVGTDVAEAADTPIAPDASAPSQPRPARKRAARSRSDH